MPLADGYHDVPAGKIAVAVTSLEMLAPAPARATPAGAHWVIRRVAGPDVAWYRDLFRRIGTDWLWFSRLRLGDAALAAIIRDPGVVVLALQPSAVAPAGGNGAPAGAAVADAGLLELDFRVPGECELAFFGVTAPLIGTSAARSLMNRAIAEAWARPIRRFWVHTCTGDHPRALGFYRRSGFSPFRMQVEIADDPRLTGGLPASAAPHVPLIRPQ